MSAAPDGFKALVWDIECIPMSGYFWGTRDQNIPLQMVKTDPRMICFAAQWYGTKKKDIAFHSEWGPGGRIAMLTRAHELLDEADAVIGFNSRGFDNKWAYAELLVEGFLPPSPHKDIDLYTAVKSKFRFPSNKLDYVAKRLDMGGKTAHSGWKLWEDVMDGCPKAQRLMEKYNRNDTVLTTQLYKKLLPWLPQHPNVALYGDGEVGCRKCGGINLQKRGTVATATGVYQRVLCAGCGSWSRYATKEPEFSSPYRAI